MQRLPVTVVVLTRNEERNLPACLASVRGWTEAVYVVDSGSVDRTVAVAAAYGAAVLTHPFESHARQWSWALRHLPIATPWVLALDADQRVSPALAHEVATVLTGGVASAVNGFYLPRRQMFRGRWIRHGGYYPKYLLKLFRASEVWIDEDELVDHHFRVHGRPEKLTHDLIEENLQEDDIAVWVAKHVRYASLQAEEEVRRHAPSSPSPAREPGAAKGRRFEGLFGSPDARARFLKLHVWERLPRYLRPFLYFFYRYVVRLGVLDGKEGFVFHFLQAYWYRLLVDIKVDELRARPRAAPDDPFPDGPLQC